jgi:hypothetical protein
MTDTLHTVLLFALPASGKSEVRTYLDHLTKNNAMDGFPIGPTLQLDDYPYVHFMHLIDDELGKYGQEFVFYRGPNRPFKEAHEWGTLIELLNEDYEDLMASRVVETDSAANLIFDRLDEARAKVGLPRKLAEIPYGIRMEIAATMEEECQEELKRKNGECVQDKAGKTIFIEAARGGENGAAFPLTPPRGYQYALSRISDKILDNSTILYVWVTPEQSRKKNFDRGKPNAQGSILHHSVPLEVMLEEYGCDDMEWLIGKSQKPNTVTVEKIVVEKGEDGEDRFAIKTWLLPVGRCDNRDDLTSFIRNKEWKPEEVKALHKGMQAAFNAITKK